MKARGRVGAKNRVVGKRFEQLLEAHCTLNQICFIRIKQQADWRRQGPKLILVPARSDFDYILIKDSDSVYIDCKSFDQSRITYSMLTFHQIVALERIKRYGPEAGYLVFHRDINEIVFYDGKLLGKLKPRESVSPDDGLRLGSIESFNLSKLFE